MNPLKEELIRQLDKLSDHELAEILDFVRVLQEEPEKLSPEEAEALEASRDEVARGDWVRWKDIKRSDV
ncbi:MAG: hypothetical protein ACE5JQ_11175 [Candidatus Methylomirabilales bacterium]